MERRFDVLAKFLAAGTSGMSRREVLQRLGSTAAG